jgi:hypothetical protein
MLHRSAFLVAYAHNHAPVSVRQLYYAATVAGLPGIDKIDSDSGYNKVQYLVLKLRRDGHLSYDWIADSTRWMRKPRTHDSVQDALEETARLYRRALWSDAPTRVEIWCEKDALAGVMLPVTSKYDVPLMVTRGFASETFAFEAVQQYSSYEVPTHVYYFGDFDRAGVDAANDIRRKLERFAADSGVEVVFHIAAVRPDQIETFNLPTRAPKRKSGADKNWQYDYACELDAIPPDLLRSLVEGCIAEHMPEQRMAALLEAEKSERETLRIFAKHAA